MDIEMRVRRSQSKESFQRVFLWEKIDICKFVNEIDSFSTNTIIQSYLLWANETFQGVIHKCPYRKLSVSNLTLSLDSSYEIDTIVPNGEIIHKIHLYNSRDRNIGTFRIIWKQNLIDLT